jgi:hypothetical protein
MPPPRPENTCAALIARAQAVAARLGDTRLPLKTFCDEAGVNPSRIYARFDDWQALCDAAGLEGGAAPSIIPAETLLSALHEAILKAGGLESQRRLIDRVHWSKVSYHRRFGGWGGTLSALRDWVAGNAPDFPYRLALEERIANQARRKPYNGPAREALQTSPPWPRRAHVTGGVPGGVTGGGTRACGSPLAFRALTHAPVNELGVVFLFGMVAGELGYAVDYVGASFPDCLAKRLVADGPRDADARWEPVRVEFEYRSRNFFYHGHDAASCDVVVCWQHDWPDCPIEVLELRRVVEGLQQSGGASYPHKIDGETYGRANSGAS